MSLHSLALDACVYWLRLLDLDAEANAASTANLTWLVNSAVHLRKVSVRSAKAARLLRRADEAFCARRNAMGAYICREAIRRIQERGSR